jgi:beta-glucanase (GH16 family)
VSEWPYRGFAGLAMVAASVVSLTSCESNSGSPQPPPAPGAVYASPPPPSLLAAGRRYVGGDEFNGPGINPQLWGAYDSVGSGGAGLRRPSQITQSNGALTISCTADGTTGGMMHRVPQLHGLWETRVKMTAASSNIHPVLLLWPKDGNWPAGGEIDYMEVPDPARLSSEGFLHYGKHNSQTHGSVQVDLTSYNVFSVSWSDTGVTYYVNNVRWFSDTERSHIPLQPMQAAIQLDYTGGHAIPGTMTVDWIRIYE